MLHAKGVEARFHFTRRGLAEGRANDRAERGQRGLTEGGERGEIVGDAGRRDLPAEAPERGRRAGCAHFPEPLSFAYTSRSAARALPVSMRAS
ncbi:MAG TPA: hypothetical protein VGM56_00175, partial [Byssovorax sp.]